MTPTQFAALAQLTRLRQSPSAAAARAVLVDGMRPADAARAHGVSPAGVSNAVTRMRKALDLASIASSAPGCAP